jgi:hypothetical protein
MGIPGFLGSEVRHSSGHRRQPQQLNKTIIMSNLPASRPQIVPTCHYLEPPTGTHVSLRLKSVSGVREERGRRVGVGEWHSSQNQSDRVWKTGLFPRLRSVTLGKFDGSPFAHNCPRRSKRLAVATASGPCIARRFPLHYLRSKRRRPSNTELLSSPRKTVVKNDVVKNQ